ncbi:MAG: hypothetical protein ACNA76_10085, partial [Anaerosomatales bacterium]
ESARRARVLRGRDRHLRATYAEARWGEEAELLVEEVSTAGSDRTAVGTTGDYLRASIAADDVSPGDLVRVRLGEEVAGVLVAGRL